MLTIGGILLVVALVTGITQDRIRTARKARASAQDTGAPAAAEPDKPHDPHQPTT